MTMISDDKVREVRSRAGILEVVTEYVRLKRSGANFLGLCPFHNEKTPSFSVNPGKEIFHCFGCGVGGDVFAFIMKVEGLQFPEAVKFLARRFGVPIDDRPATPDEKRREDERELFCRMMECAARFYSGILMKDERGKPARLYLEKRNVDLENAEKCRLGFAPEGWDVLSKYLEKMRFPLDAAAKLGLVRQRDTGGYYDTFRNRLLFTIADPGGRCVGFGGRILDNSLPKYLNSPESPVYHKSDILYGVDIARQAIRETGTVFVVEGYFDHLSLYGTGIRNVVATCGTALTGSHAKLLKRYAEKVYILFDGDNAGRKATIKATDLFLQETVPAHVVVLPPGEDPDTFICGRGIEDFNELVKKSLPCLEHFLREVCRDSDIGSVDGKSKVLREVAPRVAMIKDGVQQDLYIKEVSRLLGVEVNTVLKAVRGGQRAVVVSTEVSKKKGESGMRAQEMLLSLMGKYKEICEKVVQLGVSELFDDGLAAVAQGIVSQKLMNKPVDWPTVFETVSCPEEKSRLRSLFIKDQHLEEIDPDKAFEQCVAALERMSLRDMKDLARKLAVAEPGTEQYRQLLERVDSLRNRKSRLS